LKIIDSGYIGRAQAGTARACLTFGTITPLSNGELLATARAGENKDSDFELIELYRSTNNGKTWGVPKTPFRDVIVDGKVGTLKLCYLTELSDGHILAAAMWVDRTTHPSQPLFNSATEGCLPMAILLANSFDNGETWTKWKRVPIPEALGPPSITNPVLKLPGGTLVLSIENNKHYHDTSAWMQKVVFLHSNDLGQTWSPPISAAEDPEAKIFNWDLRCGVTPDGRIASFSWTYDKIVAKYINIHRRISPDGGQSWSRAFDIGFADQAGPPAILPDGRVVLPWVDRFGDQCIRVRIAPEIDAPFDSKSEIVIYRHQKLVLEGSKDTASLLAGMETWGFGLPYAATLPNGEVLVSYYAVDALGISIHFVRLSI
jgi:hypothetical protein